MVKTGKIHLDIEIVIPEETEKVTISKGGEILLFNGEPALHGIADWSNRHLMSDRPIVIDHGKIVISVK